MLTVVHDQESSNEKNPGVGRSLLDGIVRDGAQQMLTAALLGEVAAYIEQFGDQVDEAGHRLVVRNGYHQQREVLTAAGAVTVAAPRVNDRRVDPDSGERQRFASAILPAWARKSPRMTEVLPLLYLHGLSTGDFGPALEQFLGTGAGVSAASITRLNALHLVALVRAGAVFSKANCRTPRRHHTRHIKRRAGNRGIGGRLKLADPQVLTISLAKAPRAASLVESPLWDSRSMDTSLSRSTSLATGTGTR